MPWARLDDNFHSHPKTYIAGLDGCGLFCKAVSYAAHYLTDGFVPSQWIEAQLPGTKRERDKARVVARLIEAGLFEQAEGGYMIHGYLDLNPAKADVEKDRAAAAERMANRRGRSREVRANTTRSSGEVNLPHTHTRTHTEAEASEQHGENPDFAAWLSHHQGITGMRPPREGTLARAKVASMYGARRQEGYTAEDLCLATLGAFNDSYRRENGYYGHVSVLRPEKVHEMVEKGRRGPVAPARPSNEHPATRRIRELEELKQKLAAEERAA